MRRNIPSLATLEAFDAVSRFGTTVRAAEELGRTQSAISRQIANLELQTAQRLFDRSPKGLHLTAAGNELYRSTTAALNLLDRSIERVRAQGNDTKRIRLKVWPTFGARWLGSRLMHFPRDQVGADFSLSTGLGVSQEAELKAFQTDAAIIYGNGEWSGIASFLLVAEQIVVVGAPHLVNRKGNDIAGYDWLHMNARPSAWPKWLAANELRQAPPIPNVTHDIGMLIELASLGMGLAAVPSVYVERELASGALVAPFGNPVSTGSGYYLCYLTEDSERPEFARFKDWLLSTCSP